MYGMRALTAMIAAALVVAPAPAPAPAAASSPRAGGARSARARRAAAPAGRTLTRSLALGMRQSGVYSGAEVVDLTTGRTLYAHNAGVGRLPASVEKLYTTTTALMRFGPGATLSTTLLGAGTRVAGSYAGTLYLRGGGDPTFGSAAFDHTSYGTGATMEQLVADLVSATGMQSFAGTVIGDESLFDSIRGTPATNEQPSLDVEGELSALSYDRGWTSAAGTAYFAHPALEAGQQLVAALQAAGVRMVGHITIRAGTTPPGAQSLATVASPTIADLIRLTNTPSDNYFAETLLKDIGARFGAGGTTAAGAGVVSAQMATSFGIHPRLNDGSGLSRSDLTAPAQVVTLLRSMAGNGPFTRSLAVAGETGTLQDEMRSTYAQGRCQGKTGTLTDVSNLVGYCHARDGHTLAFAFLMNGVYPDYAHPVQNAMAIAVARYSG
jgi:D-alanyl-D-alanine carboxypeptidase/D-alanyl-D-alanine-endopeptidase (penicillin-binding protein 4)